MKIEEEDSAHQTDMFQHGTFTGMKIDVKLKEMIQGGRICVLTTERVVHRAQIIGRGVGCHAGEEERTTDRSTLLSANISSAQQQPPNPLSSARRAASASSLYNCTAAG